MKIIRPLVLILGLLSAVICLQAQPASAENDYAAFEALLREQPPGSPKEMGIEKFLVWRDAHYQKISRAGLAFYQDYPADPRRWDAVMGLASRPPLFATAYGPDIEQIGPGAAIVDEAAKAAWANTVAGLQQALLAAPDAPEKHREAVEWGQFAKDFRATSAAKAKGASFDFAGFRARYDAHAARYAALDVVADRATDYLGALERNLPGSSLEIWRHLLEGPNAKLREVAAARLHFLELMSKPLDIAFTAADGRAVDLKNLRGKVVLVDFWATWCGPCIAELPNVKRVYAACHDKGFEVVGISLENAGLGPKDTPEQVATKLEAAKRVLAEFTAKNEMPWPQYFDGKHWKNDLSTQYDIKGIPAMFLLDQDGRIVSSDARGPKLEIEVKRLLKL